MPFLTDADNPGSVSMTSSRSTFIYSLVPHHLPNLWHKQCRQNEVLILLSHTCSDLSSRKTKLEQERADKEMARMICRLTRHRKDTNQQSGMRCVTVGDYVRSGSIFIVVFHIRLNSPLFLVPHFSRSLFPSRSLQTLRSLVEEL